MLRFIYKEIGETPLECLHRYNSSGTKMTYAGRLDPVAEGVLLILDGEEIKDKGKYLKLDKIYTYTFCYGIRTDSYDSLGLIKEVNTGSIFEEKFDIGEIEHEYPPFSSKTIDGVPMFQLARENKLDGKDIPLYKGSIKGHKLISKKNLSGREISRIAINKVKKVRGDFRQGEILNSWAAFEKKYGSESFEILTLNIRVSSGVYIRNIANDMVGFALAIKRDKIIV